MNLGIKTAGRYISIEEQIKEDLYISSLDPLYADELLQKVPALNEKRDTIALVLMLVDILPSMTQAAAFSVYEACAAMRDLGILLGSLKRHGVEPVHVIPQLEDKLNLLGDISGLPPRDTLIHYVRWNPEDKRERTYTATADERQLIASVRVAMPALHKAILRIDQLYSMPLDAPQFVPLCEEVTDNFNGMVIGVVNARRNVNPKYFAEELRFYFDPIILNNREYLGPGAVEMPVFLFDHILWNCDLHDEKYVEFKETYLPYNQEFVRELYDKYRQLPSLSTRIIAEMAMSADYSEEVMASVKAFNKLFNCLKSFRAPHKKLADEAYVHTGKDEYREKGSGGYDPGILHYIIHLNAELHEKLKVSTKEYMELCVGPELAMLMKLHQINKN